MNLNTMSSAYIAWKLMAQQREIFKCISIERPLNFFANVDWPMLKFFMWGRNIWARKVSILLKNKVTPMKFSIFCSLFRHTRLYGYHIWRFYIKIKAMLQQEKENSSKYQESRKLPHELAPCEPVLWEYIETLALKSDLWE